MRRVATQIKLSETEVRHRVRFESDPCEAGTDLAKREQFRLLKLFSDDPFLSSCGLRPFQTMKMWHGGQCWLVEFEAVVGSGGGGGIPERQSEGAAPF